MVGLVLFSLLVSQVASQNFLGNPALISFYQCQSVTCNKLIVDLMQFNEIKVK